MANQRKLLQSVASVGEDLLSQHTTPNGDRYLSLYPQLQPLAVSVYSPSYGIRITIVCSMRVRKMPARTRLEDFSTCL